METRTNATTMYFLKEDYEILKTRVQELKDKIKELGQAQAEANMQSTENMGHDDAVQEVVNNDRNVILAQLRRLEGLLQGAQLIEPKKTDKITLGSIVTFANGLKIRVGSFESMENRKPVDVSYVSPLGKSLIGKEVGDEIKLKDKDVEIISVE